ncbi:hypothetical protein [Candidatus Similichlamydia laticola]|uniref:Uncharacterized protein n=1 Tax=Candidatus Similichlamydia laticola TaxID=2170265 RepID=A0A369KJB6_9BACT|nr:hypothetical protein [Candidatus Similichlamydia laticola]RDB31844.1 hypothetical protein HAT2_00046 [Candidatus Similichlamydia laticola]
MQRRSAELGLSHPVELEFFKSLILKFAPDQEKQLCALLPEEEAKVVSSLKTVPLDQYPDLIQELSCWHPKHALPLTQGLPKYLREVWDKMMEEGGLSPFVPKVVERSVLNILIRSGANRALFVEKSRFSPLLKTPTSVLKLLFELVSFRLMMQSSQFLIAKEKRQIFFDYVLQHPNKALWQSYCEAFSKRTGHLPSGTRFIWSKWNGEKSELDRMTHYIGLMSLGICVHKGTHLAFLLGKRLKPEDAEILFQNALPSSIPNHIIKDLQNIVFDSMQFIHKNKLDQTVIGGERAHV